MPAFASMTQKETDPTLDVSALKAVADDARLTASIPPHSELMRTGGSRY